MAVVLIFLFSIIYVAVVIRYLWKKFNKAKETNPYISIHKGKIKNDEHYDKYLEWLSKEGHGVPIDKVVSREDARVDKKIQESMRKRSSR